eukprot:CAMPEP_0170310074 /NCGR_PEP_ID=MMETSP0116_2-20130129/55515_1 /TAXON_ID=400756 /ORGANISM="Durinskia baltica, Strain CSIRO CS-38" /LENGTH=138 /DNA_ID=CAMNT_0010562333 /DNA_START=38 /DNA_END=452 /DNA_ORIENTATION=-
MPLQTTSVGADADSSKRGLPDGSSSAASSSSDSSGSPGRRGGEGKPAGEAQARERASEGQSPLRQAGDASNDRKPPSRWSGGSDHPATEKADGKGGGKIRQRSAAAVVGGAGRGMGMPTGAAAACPGTTRAAVPEEPL